MLKTTFHCPLCGDRLPVEVELSEVDTSEPGIMDVLFKRQRVEHWCGR